jgi:hypothetical protein
MNVRPRIILASYIYKAVLYFLQLLINVRIYYLSTESYWKSLVRVMSNRATHFQGIVFLTIAFLANIVMLIDMLCTQNRDCAAKQTNTRTHNTRTRDWTHEQTN